MSAAEQHELETYRVMVFRRGGAEVLLVQEDGRFLLPSVSIPRWERVAENINAVVRSEWGEEVICLFTLESTPAGSNGNEIHYQVAEHRQSVGTPRPSTQWLDVSALSENFFSDPADYRAIQCSVAKCGDDAADGQPNPFARLGWFRDLYHWVGAVAEQQGFHLNGSVRQLNASPSFSLIRFETDGPAFWFKAVGEPNQREFPITRALSSLFPEYVPSVLAERPQWNGWLTKEACGCELADTRDVELWTACVKNLADLQIASTKHRTGILASGARDLSCHSLARLVQPFIDVMAYLMSEQTRVPPPVLNRGDLECLGKCIEKALRVLDGLHIPDTIGHLDLNPGNIIVSGERCTFLDWTEAYVGNPFLSLEYLLENFRHIGGAYPVAEAELKSAYARQWEPTLPYTVIRAGVAVSPLLAAFAYATATGMFCDQERLRQPGFAGYLRSLTRRMSREAGSWSEPCKTRTALATPY